MKILVKITAAVLASLLFYVLVFTVIKKPVSLGSYKTIYEIKLDYSRKVRDEKKIVIIAGSNGINSHSCRVIEEAAGTKCVNAAQSAVLGIDFLLEKGKEFINPGDVVILPLEYHFYTQGRDEVIYANDGNNYILEYERPYIFRFGMEKAAATVFSMTFKDVFSSLVEGAVYMTVRFKDVYNRNGDRTGHTRERAGVYKASIAASKQYVPSKELLKDGKDFYSQKVIADFIKWCRERDVVVYGSLPTVFNDKKIDERLIGRIKKLYSDNGARFIELDNDSQYPRDCFFDTGYHLNAECQKQHSLKISDYLTAAESDPAR